MNNWFVSYAHQLGFGRVVVELNRAPQHLEDVDALECTIQQRFGYDVPPIVLYYHRMAGP